MLRILIVDDDIIIRKGLKVMIENETTGFEVVGEAANGVRGLEAVKERKPDIVITDIKMPLMNGIELVDQLGIMPQSPKVIVLSGYDEYEYVRETMKRGAVDYLLKPVDNDELVSLLENTKKRIEAERMVQQRRSAFSQKVSQSMYILRQKFFIQLLQNDSRFFKDQTRCQETDFSKWSHYMLAVLEADDILQNNNTSKWHLKFGNIDFVEQYLNDAVPNGEEHLEVVFVKLQSQIVGLFMSDRTEREAVGEGMVSFLHTAKDFIHSKYNISVSAAASDVYTDIGDTHRNYRHMLLLLENRFYAGKNRIFVGNCEQYRFCDLNADQLERLSDRLLKYVEIGDYSRVKNTVKAIFDTIAEQGRVEPKQIRDFLSALIWKVFVLVPDFREMAENKAYENAPLLSYVHQCKTLQDLKGCLTSGLYEITRQLHFVRQAKNNRIVEMAKVFLMQHYRQDITLKMVAEKVFTNPNYLSELFKNETGKNFSDYLVEIRINEAKRLLKETRLKSYEIGELVGYNEAVSFSRAFKKFVGISPNEYRRVIG